MNGHIPRPSLATSSPRNGFTMETEAETTKSTDTPKSYRQRVQNDTSLGATAKRFVALMTNAVDQTIELNEAARKLAAPKRRIYDVTNVLEGIGLVTKKAKNHFEWVGGDVDSNGQVEPDEIELQRLRNWEKELTTAIEQQETQLRYMTENNDSLGYVTCKDIRTIFNQKMVLCIKGQADTKIQIPDTSEGYQMMLKSNRGPIQCYLCPDIENADESSDKSNPPHSSLRELENNDSNDSRSSNQSKFLPFSPLSEQDYLFTLAQNEGMQELFDLN